MSSFGDFSLQAAAYGVSRPGYPTEFISLLAEKAGVVAGDPVVDLGAGTGISSRLLADLGLRVTAVEPNQAMREQADLPGVTWVDGRFDATGLPAQSQAWAVSAQAFHWAQSHTALPEIQRILRPAAMFTVLWNNRVVASDTVVGWTEQAIRRFVPDFNEAYRNRNWDQLLESSGDFRFVSRDETRHAVLMSPERYLQLWRSHNRLANIAGPDRMEEFLAELKDYLQREEIPQIEVVYKCEAWTAQRIEK
ncbi:class I SAM-dependent methyltransferase [Blastopirellula marina]|uniref:SAM-dependent methyltransferase n=1 Tax=Blastopirellula marina TaxID=124 RepID=A0A2S8FWA7_9BACT|nr:methyltransferase domain-containing protein [Blastopirellula marina]PQO36459.1 SAM-dependent methyltransferase [Blastopirellula marina]PQO47342.1 SAM-dependent methyltransferase [Blastopirellula marina]PTL44296.1 class I SAM-dependent methyltransferase [Blastopirellula marina]